jgi:hypothetical protein
VKTAIRHSKRRRAEHNRSIRLGRRNFCSLSCAGSQSWEHLKQYEEKNIEKLVEYNKLPSLLDEFSPFRKFRNSARKRDKESSITLQDLKSQWEKQKGICPYTGWPMMVFASAIYGLEQKYNPYKASLDRIDSSKGYVPDNIQFVCYMANIAKNQYPESFLVEFCKAVADNHK